MDHDTIVIRELTLSTQIGVTAEERAKPQAVSATIKLDIDTRAAARDDNLALTIDYAAVAPAVRQIALARERNLLETLAEEIAAYILRDTPAHAVTVELRKFVLPETRYVAVRIRRP